MHAVYHRLPGERREPTLSRTKAGRADGERLRLKDGKLYDEALNTGINCKRCEVACPSTLKSAILSSAPGSLQHAKADAAGRYSEPYRSDGQRLDAVCPAGVMPSTLPQTGGVQLLDATLKIRPSPQPAEIFSRHLSAAGTNPSRRSRRSTPTRWPFSTAAM